MAEEKKLEVFPIGITAKEIVKVVEDAGISGGGSTEITADDIDSGAATNGQVLTADGSGGAAWANVSGGGASYPSIVSLEKSAKRYTFAELIEALDITYTSNRGYNIAFINSFIDPNNNDLQNVEWCVLSFYTYGTLGSISLQVCQLSDWKSGTAVAEFIVGNATTTVFSETENQKLYHIIPDTYSLNNEKSYTLKCVNGTIQWVEDQA